MSVNSDDRQPPQRAATLEEYVEQHREDFERIADSDLPAAFDAQAILDAVDTEAEDTDQ